MLAYLCHPSTWEGKAEILSYCHKLKLAWAKQEVTSQSGLTPKFRPPAALADAGQLTASSPSSYTRPDILYPLLASEGVHTYKLIPTHKHTEINMFKTLDRSSCTERINTVKMAILLKAVHRFNTIPIKILTQSQKLKSRSSTSC